MAYISPATSEAIIENMRLAETRLQLQASNAFKSHPPAYARLRPELVQWTISMSESLSYSYATVFSAVRFMDLAVIDPVLFSQMFPDGVAGAAFAHLIAAGCLLLGSKIEESDEREANLADFLTAWETSQAPMPTLPEDLFPFSAQSAENSSVRLILAISAAERAVLRAIRFDVHVVTPMVFADAYLAAALHVLADCVAPIVQQLVIVGSSLLLPNEALGAGQASSPRVICDHAVSALSSHFIEALLTSLSDETVTSSAYPSHVTVASTLVAASVVLPSAFPWAAVLEAASAYKCGGTVAPPTGSVGRLLDVVGVSAWSSIAAVATLLAVRVGLHVTPNGLLMRAAEPQVTPGVGDGGMTHLPGAVGGADGGTYEYAAAPAGAGMAMDE